MRKFLSILMLACLLCGMVLPVAAEDGQLYAKLSDGTWTDSLTVTQNVPTKVWFSTESTGTGALITAGITSSDTSVALVGPDDESAYTLTATTLTGTGAYTLTYSDGTNIYTISVTVTPASTLPVTSLEIPTADLGKLAGTSEEFLAYLTGKGYSGSGDLTLLLPAEDLGNVTCNVQLPGDAVLTLKGVSGTKMTGLVIGGSNIGVDGITFTGNPGITVNGVIGCTVSNCKFNASGNAFQLQQDSDGNTPGLTLSGNTYYNSGKTFTMEVKGSGEEKWEVTVPSETTSIDGTLFKVTETAVENGTQFFFDSRIVPLVSDEWTFIYCGNCSYSKAYVVNEGTLVARENKFTISKYGAYTVVDGTPPGVTTKDTSTKTVTITKEQSQYLRKVSLNCGFKAAKVTDSKGNTVYSYLDSNGNVTFNVKENTADTYTIKDVSTTTTTTTTKSTTTSRSYNYKYQDYYLITPQRVTDRMRYVEDNLVTIECKEAGRRSISLPVASMAAAAEKGYSILLKNEKVADITLDAAALKSMAQQAKGTTVLLHYRSLNHKTLTTVGQASVQSHLAQYPNDSADLAFLVTATSDSETIEDLQRGTITLKIPFIVLPGTEEYDNVVYALQGESVAEARETTVADGYLTTKLLDLTEHMVFQVGEPVETTEETTEPTVETTVETTEETTQPETEPVTEVTQPPEPEETDKGFPIWIPIVIVALLAGGGAAAYFLILRKRLKK